MEFEPRHILIFHIAGLSETILALPALRALRHHFPAARITVASSAMAAEVLRMEPGIDEVLPVVRLRGGEWIRPGAVYRGSRSVRELRRGGFDAVIEFQRGPESALLSRLAGLRPSATKSSGALAVWLEKVGASVGRTKTLHATQEYLQRLEPWNVRPVESHARLCTLREADERLERWLEKHKIQPGELLIGLHPGAGPGEPRWPLERVLSLGSRFIHNFNARVVLVSGPNERGLARRLQRQLPARKALALESPRPADWVSACARLSLFVGHAGGPAHLAAAAGASVLALSTKMEFSSTELLGPRVETLRAPQIQLISEETVYEAACKLLQMSRAEGLRAR